MRSKFNAAMTPYADRCHSALEPYREQARWRAPLQPLGCHALTSRPRRVQMLTGQGSLKNSDLTARLKQSLR